MSNVIQVGDKMFFHPGYYLQEWLEGKNMSVEEFADKTQISVDDVNAIIAGNRLVKDFEKAAVSEITGISPAFWRNVEAGFLRGIYSLRIPKPVFITDLGEIGCPNCKSGYGIRDEDDDPNKFCGRCGQALKWEENKK